MKKCMTWFASIVFLFSLSLFSYESQALQELRLVGFTDTLASAGTAEAVFPSGILIRDFVVQASDANVGNCIVGADDVLFATGNGVILIPGASVAPDALGEIQTEKLFNLNKIFYDCANSSDKIHGAYVSGG